MEEEYTDLIPFSAAVMAANTMMQLKPLITPVLHVRHRGFCCWCLLLRLIPRQRNPAMAGMVPTTAGSIFRCFIKIRLKRSPGTAPESLPGDSSNPQRSPAACWGPAAGRRDGKAPSSAPRPGQTTGRAGG